MIILFSFLSVQETYSQFVFLFLCLVPFKWTLFATSIYFPFSIYCFQSFPFIASCRTCPLIFFTLSQSFSLDQNLPVSVFLYYFTPPPPYSLLLFCHFSSFTPTVLLFSNLPHYFFLHVLHFSLYAPSMHLFYTHTIFPHPASPYLNPHYCCCFTYTILFPLSASLYLHPQ